MYAPPTDSVTRQLLRRLLDVLLPAPCLACRQPVEEPRGSLGLCPSCRRGLVRWPRSACAGCGEPLAGEHLPEGSRCGPCRRSPPPTSAVLSAWSYQPPIDSVLTGLKFHRLGYLGTQLGRELAELVRPRLTGDETVVPMPLHWTRHLARGYNQAALIARPLAETLGLRHVRALRRRRWTAAQSRLPRADRQRNLVGVFAVRKPRGIRGRHVLLVDDVVTTGATLRSAAACLLEHGAAAVTGVCAARTPVTADKCGVFATPGCDFATPDR